MKKTLLALAIPALLLANGANAYEVFNNDDGAVEVYGQLRAKATKSPDKDVTLDEGGSRTGVNANYNIAEGVDVFGKIEYSVGSDSLANRLSNFGFTGDFGTVTLGKQYLTADDLWGVDNSYFFGGSHIVEGAVSGGKHDSAIRYVYENDSIYIDASYGLPEDDASAEVAELFARVNVAGFDITAGVSKAELSKAAIEEKEIVKDDSGNIVEQVTNYAAGDYEDLYHTVWVERSFDDLSVGVQYASSTIEETISNKELERTGYTLALNYSLSDKSSVYGGYEYTEYNANFTPADSTIKKDGDSTVAYLGAVHKFNQYFRVYGEAAHVDGTSSVGINNEKNGLTVESGKNVDSEMYYAIGARVYW